MIKSQGTVFKSAKVWLPPIIVGLLCLSPLVWADEIDDLVPFIIQVESNGDRYALSKDNCRGLMQVSEVVLNEFYNIHLGQSVPQNLINAGIIGDKTVLDLYNPVFNKYVGSWYLHRLRDHYLKENYTIERLLAGYNGGITRLKQCNYDVSKMPKETRNYVHKIMRLYRKAR